MKAYFVHDVRKQQDAMVLPESDLLIPVDRRIVMEFIAVTPDFTQWTSGSRLNGLAPQTFGCIVATREPDGDVCIVDESLWRRRMAYHLDTP